MSHRHYGGEASSVLDAGIRNGAFRSARRRERRACRHDAWEPGPAYKSGLLGPARGRVLLAN
jgi:hypothetical protein